MSHSFDQKSLSGSFTQTEAGSGVGERSFTIVEPSEVVGFSAVRPKIPRSKRALDILVVCLSLPLTLPIMVLVACWILLNSRGTVFFKQERIGLGGVPFTMIKFRTMKMRAETKCHEDHVREIMASGKPMTKLDVVGDMRLIRGARLLRSFGIDELPQIINVLAGTMSLVGPRPCTRGEFRSYRADQYRRFETLPGITGYWQVYGKNSTTFAEMVALDDRYVAARSVWLDLGVIAQTIPAMVCQAAENCALRRLREMEAVVSIPEVSEVNGFAPAKSLDPQQPIPYIPAMVACTPRVAEAVRDFDCSPQKRSHA